MGDASKKLKELRKCLPEELAEEVNDILRELDFREKNEVLTDDDIKKLENLCNKITEMMVLRFLGSKYIREDKENQEIYDFYKIELKINRIGEFVLKMKPHVWKDESTLPALLKKGVFHNRWSMGRM